MTDKKKSGFVTNVYKALQMELREHKISFFVYFFLRTMVIFSMVRQAILGNYEGVFLCMLTLLLLMLPSLLQVTLKIEIPKTLEIIILIFIFAAEILGEIHEFYIIIPFWDTILHTLNGFLAAAIGFSLVDLLNRHEKFVFKLSPLFMAIVSFCFSMTIGVVWEFFEFGMDMIFNFDMQKDTIMSSITSVVLDPAKGNNPVTINNIKDVAINDKSLGVGGYLDIGLIDTMEDLLVNFLGAIVFSVFGFFYVKKQGKNTVLQNIIPQRKEKNKDFLKIVKEDNK